eukprot:6212583-Pleurochrysis_carterae.AAC.3
MVERRNFVYGGHLSRTRPSVHFQGRRAIALTRRCPATQSWSIVSNLRCDAMSVRPRAECLRETQRKDESTERSRVPARRRRGRAAASRRGCDTAAACPAWTSAAAPPRETQAQLTRPRRSYRRIGWH